MIKLLKPLISLWRLTTKTKNMKLAYQLLPEVYTPSFDSTVSVKGNIILFDRYDKRFSKTQLKLFKGHGELLLKFVKSAGVSFVQSTESYDKVIINFNGFNIQMGVKGYENLKVIEEVFIDRLYDFDSNDQYIVCDVGMNIATASLFFASFKNVEKVYSYEPFASTYLVGLSNLKANPELSKKVEAMNFGLGKKDERLGVPLSDEGSLGGSTDASFIERAFETKNKMVDVEIRNIGEVLKSIRMKHPNMKIILKLDCEGAEYDILSEMEANKLIGDVAIYMVEFHFRGKEVLQNIFNRNNFFILSPSNESISEYGMLYALNLYNS